MTNNRSVVLSAAISAVLTMNLANAANIDVNGQGVVVNNGQHQMSIAAPVFNPNMMQASSPNAAGRFSEFSTNVGSSYDAAQNVNAAGRFNDVVRFLADQLIQNRDVKNMGDTSFAVASIVGLDDVSRTNKLGYLVQEHLMHELQVRGFKVVDFKLMNDQIQVTNEGDFVFSRDPKRLKKSYDIADVVSGTYSFQAEGVVLNVRAVDTKTGVISTSAQAYIPRSDYEYIITGKQGAFYNGEYFYRESSQVRVIDRPVAYEGVHNAVRIAK
jgi:TolB-like protein